jgi:hypothetical protein
MVILQVGNMGSTCCTGDKDLDDESLMNPWNVKQLEDFQFFCCPECPDKSSTKENFVNHALIQHPQVTFILHFAVCLFVCLFVICVES